MAKHKTIQKTTLCALFVALITAGAYMKIPVPVVPFTLQYLFTMLAGLLLGKKNGFLAVCAYITLGLTGFPVFAQGSGIGYVFQPSFGYLIGFALGAFTTGWLAEQKKRPEIWDLLAANFAGLGVVYLIGITYCWTISRFYLNSPIGLGSLILYCFLLALPGDIFLCVAAAVMGKRMIPFTRERLSHHDA